MATSETQLKAVLTLVDRISPQLKGLQKNFNYFKRDLRVAVREARSGFRALGDSAAAASAAIATVAAAGAGTWAATSAAADAAVRLDQFARQTGVATERLQAWQTVAVASGQEADEFAEALRDMNIELSDAATGGKDELAQLLIRVGIAARNADGSIRDANAVFLDFSDAVARQTDPMIQYRMAILAFGEDTGAKLLPVLREGSAAFRDAEKAMRATGSAITQQQIERLKSFRTEWNLTRQAMNSMATSALSRIAPALSTLSKGFSDALARVRPLINARMDAWAARLDRSIRSINWDSVFSKIDALVSGGEKLRREWGFLGSAIEFIAKNIGTIVALYIGGKATVALVSFGQAVWTLGGALVSFVKFLTPLIGAGSPLILLGTLAAGVAMALITNAESIKKFFLPVIESIGNAFDWLVEKVRSTLNFVANIPNKIKGLVQGIFPFFGEHGEAINNAIKTAQAYDPHALTVNVRGAQAVAARAGVAEQSFTPSTPTETFYTVKNTDNATVAEVTKPLNVKSEAKVSGAVEVVFANAPEGLSIKRARGEGVDVDATIKTAGKGRGPYAPRFPQMVLNDA